MVVELVVAAAAAAVEAVVVVDTAEAEGLGELQDWGSSVVGDPPAGLAEIPEVVEVRVARAGCLAQE